MRIVTVDALAFGPLCRARLELAPGLTVICGRNEAGKSSWHAAIQLGMSGMRRARGRRRSEEELIRRYRPWSGDEWKVRLRVALEDGRELEATQDLDDPAASSIVDVATGRAFEAADLVYEGSIDLSRLLGLNREIFAAAISVRQAQILAIRDEADGLQQQLQRAAQASAADETAVAALDRLVEFRATRVGGRRKGSIRPLQGADDELRAASGALEHARREQREYTELLSALESARVGEARSGSEHERVRRTLAVRRRADLAARLEEIRPLAERFAAGAPPPTEPVAAEERDLRDLVTAWQQRPPLEPLASGPSAADLERELDALPPPPAGDIDVAPEVEAARERHGRATDDLDRHDRDAPSPPSDETLFGGAAAAELRGLAELLGRRLPEVDPSLDRELEEAEAMLTTTRRAGRAAGVAAVLALAVAVALTLAGRAAWSIVPLGAMVAALTLTWAKRRSAEAAIGRQATLTERRESQRRLRSGAELARDTAARRLASMGLPAERDALLRAAATLDDAEARRERRAHWQRVELELQTQLATAEDGLRRALGERGVVEASSAPRDRLATLVESYVARCRANREQFLQASRRTDLEPRLALRREQEERDARARALRAAMSARLMDAVRRLDLAAGDERSALDAIAERAAELGRLRSQLDEAHRDHSRLLGLLADATLPQLEEQLSDLERGLGERESDSTATEPAATARELEQAVQQSQAELERSRAVARRLEGEVAERTRSTPNVVEAEERFRTAQDAVARLESLDGILQKTIAILEEAKEETQREIAPRLRAAILPHLPLVTAGRYVDVRIDPATLEVQALERDGEWRNAMGLSHGTAEQIYLLLRIALARTLVSTDETAPLLLDDVTVQSDSERVRAILDLLHRESAGRQVILFTQQDEVAAWARARLTAPRDTVIELPGPGQALAAGAEA